MIGVSPGLAGADDWTLAQVGDVDGVAGTE